MSDKLFGFPVIEKEKISSNLTNVKFGQLKNCYLKPEPIIQRRQIMPRRVKAYIVLGLFLLGMGALLCRLVYLAERAVQKRARLPENPQYSFYCYGGCD